MDRQREHLVEPFLALAAAGCELAWSIFGLLWRTCVLAQKVIELNDEHGLAYTRRGACFEDLGRFREAKEDYVRASVLDGKTSFLAERIEICERRTKNTEE